MNSNQKKAGLLWSLLPIKQKMLIQKYLTLEEIQVLKEFQKNYQKLTKEERLKTEEQLYKMFSFPLEKFVYITFSLCLILFLYLFFYYLFRNSNVSPFYLFLLFWPFTLGIFSFLLLLTFSSFEFYLLFYMSKNKYHYFSTLIIFYILVYLLYKINQMENHFITKFKEEEIFIILIGIALAPIAEEIIFRHYIPKIFSKGLIYSILGHMISNILFALLHIPIYFEQGILYFMCGMFLSILKLYTEKLIYPVLAHSFANLTIFYFF